MLSFSGENDSMHSHGSTTYRRDPSTPTLRPTNGRPNVVDADGSPPLFSQVIKTLRFYHWLHCPKEYQLPITVSLAAPFKYRQSSKAIHAGSSGTQVPKVLGIFFVASMFTYAFDVIS